MSTPPYGVREDLKFCADQEYEEDPNTRWLVTCELTFLLTLHYPSTLHYLCFEYSTPSWTLSLLYKFYVKVWNLVAERLKFFGEGINRAIVWYDLSSLLSLMNVECGNCRWIRFASNGGVDAKSFQHMWRERDGARAGTQTWQGQSNTYGVGNGGIEAERVFEVWPKGAFPTTRSSSVVRRLELGPYSVATIPSTISRAFRYRWVTRRGKKAPGSWLQLIQFFRPSMRFIISRFALNRETGRSWTL